MDDVFGLADELGPAKVIHVHEPALGLKAVLAEVKARQVLPREAAVALATTRVRKAMGWRRFSNL